MKMTLIAVLLMAGCGDSIEPAAACAPHIGEYRVRQQQIDGDGAGGCSLPAIDDRIELAQVNHPQLAAATCSSVDEISGVSGDLVSSGTLSCHWTEDGMHGSCLWALTMRDATSTCSSITLAFYDRE